MNSKLFATAGTYPQQIVPTQEPKSTLEKMQRLYLAAFNLMVNLGREGAIHADGHAADTLMNCLHDLDGGEYNSDLFVDEGSIRNAVLDECKQLTEHLADSEEHCTAMTIINGLDSLKVSQRPDDIAVDKFAAAMKAKMAEQRAKGRGGWADKEDCPTEQLQHMLLDHIAKGDPIDVGNFAMMLWNRGEQTAAPKQAQEPVDIPRWVEVQQRTELAQAIYAAIRKEIPDLGPWKFFDVDAAQRIVDAIAHLQAPKQAEPSWQPIETAPKDGTNIDLWHEEFGRFPDCYWGLPQHTCGEAGSLCDDDFHSMDEGWVTTFNDIPFHASEYPHWMPLPTPPEAK